jgi:hypothetical protein
MNILKYFLFFISAAVVVSSEGAQVCVCATHLVHTTSVTAVRIPVKAFVCS